MKSESESQSDLDLNATPEAQGTDGVLAPGAPESLETGTTEPPADTTGQPAPRGPLGDNDATPGPAVITPAKAPAKPKAPGKAKAAAEAIEPGQFPHDEPAPPQDEEGDLTPAYMRWMARNNPNQFLVQYANRGGDLARELELTLSK